MNAGRAFLGVVAGYIVTVALVVVLDPLVAIAMLHGSRTANAPYLAANVVLSFVAAVAGGALCARIARERQVLLGGILGALILIVGMLAASRAHIAGVTPSYGYLIAILGALGALSGGALVATVSRRAI